MKRKRKQNLNIERNPYRLSSPQKCFRSKEPLLKNRSAWNLSVGFHLWSATHSLFVAPQPLKALLHQALVFDAFVPRPFFHNSEKLGRYFNGIPPEVPEFLAYKDIDTTKVALCIMRNMMWIPALFPAIVRWLIYVVTVPVKPFALDDRELR